MSLVGSTAAQEPQSTKMKDITGEYSQMEGRPPENRNDVNKKTKNRNSKFRMILKLLKFPSTRDCC